MGVGTHRDLGTGLPRNVGGDLSHLRGDAFPGTCRAGADVDGGDGVGRNNAASPPGPSNRHRHQRAKVRSRKRIESQDELRKGLQRVCSLVPCAARMCLDAGDLD